MKCQIEWEACGYLHSKAKKSLKHKTKASKHEWALYLMLSTITYASLISTKCPRTTNNGWKVSFLFNNFPFRTLILSSNSSGSCKTRNWVHFSTIEIVEPNKHTPFPDYFFRILFPFSSHISLSNQGGSKFNTIASCVSENIQNF